MEPENTYDDVFIKYILNECTAEERVFVEEWTSKSEDNRLYIGKIAEGMRLLDAAKYAEGIDVDYEWRVFSNNISLQVADTAARLAKTVDKEEFFASDRPGLAGRGRVYRMIAAGAVAASIVLALLITGKIFSHKENNVEPGTAEAGRRGAGADTVLNNVEMYEVNTTALARIVRLPDSSLVNLYPDAEITYREPVHQHTRVVLLKGRAAFSVAKDKARPFSVFSGPIYTTALGTHFTVTALHNSNRIYVRLNEGKVVIKADTAMVKKVMKDVYLVPGQELTYDITKGRSWVKSFDGNSTPGENVTDKITSDEPVVSGGTKHSWFRFNNQSLNQIFQTLEGMYGVKIVYSKEDVSKMYFIGTFEKSDSLAVILKQIAFVNNLEIRKDNNSYIVKKRK